MLHLGALSKEGNGRVKKRQAQHTCDKRSILVTQWTKRWCPLIITSLRVQMALRDSNSKIHLNDIPLHIYGSSISTKQVQQSFYAVRCKHTELTRMVVSILTLVEMRQYWCCHFLTYAVSLLSDGWSAGLWAGSLLVFLTISGPRHATVWRVFTSNVKHVQTMFQPCMHRNNDDLLWLLITVRQCLVSYIERCNSTLDVQAWRKWWKQVANSDHGMPCKRTCLAGQL